MNLKTIGSDPELLLMDSNNVLRSAIGVIPGDKDLPFKLDCGGVVHYDNVTAEFAIPPATNAVDFNMSIFRMMKNITTMAAAHNLSVSPYSFGEYLPEELIPIEAQISGCVPDYNAWTETRNESPDYSKTRDRAAGGHVHIGVDDLTDAQRIQLVKVLDMYVTMPLMRHEDPQRRKLYGQAGAYRPKEYGLEYRTPSNAWVFKSTRRVWMYRAVRKAVEMFEDIEADPLWEMVINMHDVGFAEDLCKKHGVTLCEF
jgi:hypothetical protein